MSSLNHCNLLKTFSTFLNGSSLEIVMPLMNGGSLQNLISYKYPNGIDDIAIIATIVKETLNAICYLHDNKLIHRDIKSGNILLDMDGNIKLGDFGVATNLKKGKRNSFVGSCCWMAPEIISANDGYDCKVDNI
jgi:serine/threonine-protein kinase OSR1/STK39